MDDYTAKQIFGAIKDGIFVTDLDLRIVEVNTAFTQVTGYTPEQAIGQTPKLFSSGRHTKEFYQRMWRSVQENGQWQGTIWNRRKNGEIYPQWLFITILKDPSDNISHYLAVFSDLSHQETISNQIHLLAYYDSLTGLPNRELFTDRLNLSLSQAHRDKGKVALFFLDLDRFKYINDTLGHATGDHLLSAVAYRLSNSLRESDTVARLGGDEFTVIVSGITNESHAETVANKILACFKQPFTIGKRELLISSSIGISLYPEHGSDSETIVRHADTAMYCAKERGKNCYVFYSPDMGLQYQQRLSIENDLSEVINNNGLEMVYQPQIDLQSGHITVLEALLRWKHPERGEISPTLFLPIAEESGLILKLGAWALRTACSQMAAWRKQHGFDISLAINIFGLQLSSGTFHQQIRETLAETGLPPTALELEITENILMEESRETVNTLDKLNELGIRIVIDDFGTGYSSLNSIRRIDTKKLKIDRSFITNIGTDACDTQMIRTIVNMAHNLSISIAAEGIENNEQLQFLKFLGCDHAQGFLIGKPYPIHNLKSNFQRNFQYHEEAYIKYPINRDQAHSLGKKIQ